MPAPPRISVVLPVRNESHRLRQVLPELDAVRPVLHEIIVVDGHSADGTLDTAVRVLPRVVALTQSRNGRGNALACGFAAATGEILVAFDVHGPPARAAIGSLVDAVAAGSDLATQHRGRTSGCRGGRVSAYRLGVAAANLLFGAAFTDMATGSHAFRSDLLPALGLPPTYSTGLSDEPRWGDGPEIDVALLCRAAAAGAAIVEVAPTGRTEPTAGAARPGGPVPRGLLPVVLAEHRHAHRLRSGS